jgi:hypothetical protein
VARVASPPTAAPLRRIGLFGAANVLFLDAGTFGASAAPVAIGVPSATSARAWRR